MYDSVTSLTAGLEWGERGGVAELCAAGRPLARFTVRDGALRSSLVLPGGKAVDLSRQPAALELTVATAARRQLAHEEGWTAASAAQLTRWSRERGIAITGQHPMPAVLIRAGFPVIRMAADNGLAVPERVPAWAVQPLRLGSARAALEAAIGRRCGRGVVRAFVRSVGEGRGHFSVIPLALATAARDIGDDRLARLFDLPADAAAGAAVPERRDLLNLGSCFDRMLPASVERVVAEVLTTPQGLHRLLDAARVLRLVDHRFGPLPGSLEALEALVPAVVPVTSEQTERIHGPARAADPVVAPRAPEPIHRLPVRPLRPPVGSDTRVARFAYDGSVTRFDGHGFGALRFVLPARPADLRQWGASLDNCLHDYAGAVAAGRSIVIGVEFRGLLVAAVEIDPRTRLVTQFVGQRNRRPDPRLGVAVEQELRRFGVGVPALDRR